MTVPTEQASEIRARRTRHMWASAFNLPNQLTALRLLLAVVMFALIAADFYRVSLVLFVIAASTDWLDGYFARKYQQVTTLGRILDPFADKVIVCGTFIYLLSEPRMLVIDWGLRAWMVVVIVGRELLVTALRSFIEDRGAGFLGQVVGQIEDAAAMHCRGRRFVVPRLLYGHGRSAAVGLGPAGGVAVVGSLADGLFGRDLRAGGGALAAGKPMSLADPSAGLGWAVLAAAEVEVSQLAVVATILALLYGGLSVWGVVFRRLARGESVLPLEPRRPVPWGGLAVVLVVVTFLASAIVLDRVSRNLLGHGIQRSAAAIEVAGAEPREQGNEHPLVIAVGESRNLAALAAALFVGVIVAPVSEEFFFRLLVQGWLEKLDWKWRRVLWPGSRVFGLAPVLISSLVFAALHVRGSQSPRDSSDLLWGMTLEAVARIVTIGMAVWVLSRGLGATAADLGWSRDKLPSDVRLGLLSFLAVVVPIYGLQSPALAVAARGRSPDPFALFPFAIVLGTLYFFTHRIVPAIVLHAALNGTSLALVVLGTGL